MSDRTPIPYGRQSITSQDISEVVRVLQSDYLTQGPEIERFERAFSSYVGSRYAVAVSNGTAALHLCAMAMGVKQGDKVITTPITFAASGNCVRYCGGEVHFVDIDPHTYLIDLKALRHTLESAPAGTFAGIVPVDFAGRAVDLEKVRNLADEHGLWIIEDACHAPGGYFIDSKGSRQHCGNGRFAELAIFSFHPVKHIAAGEGGMITTNDEELYQRLLMLRTHGITKQSSRYVSDVASAGGAGPDYPGWYMEMQELGYNYRLTDFQAALGYSQLSRADDGLARRRELAARYDTAFKKMDYIKGHSGSVDGHAYHLYIVETEDREALYNSLRSQQIYAQVHYIPMHLMPYYRQFGWKPGDMPHSEAYYSRCLSLPMYPALSDAQQDFVIECVEQHFRERQ